MFSIFYLSMIGNMREPINNGVGPQKDFSNRKLKDREERAIKTRYQLFNITLI